MKRLTFMAATMIGLAVSCMAADVSTFVHASTERIRSGVSWEKPSPKLPRGVMLGDATLAVPDFTKFWPDYSTEGFLYVLSGQAASFEIVSVTLVSDETHERKEFSRVIEVASKEIAAGVWLARVRIVDRGMFDQGEFSRTKRLLLVVRWRKDGEERFTESKFELEKRTRKDIAWPT